MLVTHEKLKAMLREIVTTFVFDHIELCFADLQETVDSRQRGLRGGDPISLTQCKMSTEGSMFTVVAVKPVKKNHFGKQRAANGTIVKEIK